MNSYKTFLTATLLLSTMLVEAQVNNAHSKNALWMSYRDAYKTMLWFEKYGKPKNLIQNHLQFVAAENMQTIENQEVTLIGKSIKISLPMDEIGRVALPLLKSAYDENAELIIHLATEQKSKQIKISNSISIVPRLDNTYDNAELYLACEQALQFQQFLGAESFKYKRCAGVRFVFSSADNVVSVKTKSGNNEEKTLPIALSFNNLTGNITKLKTVSFSFQQTTEKVRIVTRSTPIAITPIFE